ncbi:hypothetical protein ABVT39_008211 [Epinephelus coioides]
MIAAGRILPFEHLPCIAHLLQRAIVVSLRDGGFDVVLAKCHKVVGHFKHSPANSDELNAQQASLGQDQEPLVQDVPTRWNSTLEMIKRVRRNRDPLHATLTQQKHNLTLPTNTEYEKLEKLEKLLEPCRYITEVLGGEKYVSCSVILPALCHLQQVVKISDDDPAYIVRFKTAFTQDLSQRREKTNLEWLKDLKCLPRAEREPVWAKLSELVKGEELAPQRPREENPEQPKKKTVLLLMGSESESDEETPVDNAVESVAKMDFLRPSVCFWLLFLLLILNDSWIVSGDRLQYSKDERLQLKYIVPADMSDITTQIPDHILKLLNTRTAGDKRRERSRRRKRGKRGSVRLRMRKLRLNRVPLPSMILGNAHSLRNKMDKLQENVRFLKDFKDSGIMTLTESWLTERDRDADLLIDCFADENRDRHHNKGMSGYDVQQSQLNVAELCFEDDDWFHEV